MTPKYKVNEEVYFMHSGTPRLEKVLGAMETIGRTFYIVNLSGGNSPDRFWMKRDLDDERTLMIEEAKVFPTSALLQASVFKDMP